MKSANEAPWIAARNIRGSSRDFVTRRATTISRSRNTGPRNPRSSSSVFRGGRGGGRATWKGSLKGRAGEADARKREREDWERFRVHVEKATAAGKSNRATRIRGFHSPCRSREIERGVSKCRDFGISVENWRRATFYMRIPLPTNLAAWHCFRRSLFKRLTDNVYASMCTFNAYLREKESSTPSLFLLEIYYTYPNM